MGQITKENIGTPIETVIYIYTFIRNSVQKTERRKKRKTTVLNDQIHVPVHTYSTTRISVCLIGRSLEPIARVSQRRTECRFRSDSK